jgi:hypothetical protein
MSKQLEDVIMSCLEKARAKRPQTARDLAHMLEKCPGALRWSVEEGDAWWRQHERGSRHESPAEKRARVNSAPASEAANQGADGSDMADGKQQSSDAQPQEPKTVIHSGQRSDAATKSTVNATKKGSRGGKTSRPPKSENLDRTMDG